MKKLVPLVLACLLALIVFAGTASASKPSLKTLTAQVVALQQTMKAQAKSIARQAHTIGKLSSRVRADEARLSRHAARLTRHGVRLNGDEAAIAGQGTQLTTAASLLALAPYVSVVTGAAGTFRGPNIFVTGANVHIVDGTQSTSDWGSTPTGLGNLIVGYDEDATDTSGSHSIVCGFANNFNSYGGLVAGYQNSVGGPCATVAGQSNAAFGEYSSVIGGYGNVAYGASSSITGGGYNEADGAWSSIGGGGGTSTGTGVIETTDLGWAAGSYHTP